MGDVHATVGRTDIDVEPGAGAPPCAERDARPPAADEHGLLRWWHSRLGYRFLCELALLSSLFVAYKAVRFIAADRVRQALQHGYEVMHLEQALGIFTETGLQRLALRSETLIRFLNQYYLLAHFTVTAAFLFWMFVRHPAPYKRVRGILITMTMFGLAIHLAYPLAPPRMYGPIGFVDTARLFGPSSYGKGSVFGGVANQFAAMPSLHFGWAVLVAWGIVKFAPGRWRWLAIVHPVLTLAAIVLTANHYWLDAIIATAIFAFALVVDRYTTRRRALQRERCAELSGFVAAN